MPRRKPPADPRLTAATEAARKAAAPILGAPVADVRARVWIAGPDRRGRPRVDQGAVDAALRGATSYRDAEKRSGISARTLARERPGYFAAVADGKPEKATRRQK